MLRDEEDEGEGEGEAALGEDMDNSQARVMAVAHLGMVVDMGASVEVDTVVGLDHREGVAGAGLDEVVDEDVVEASDVAMVVGSDHA